MKLLLKPEFQDLLVNYPKAQRVFVKAYEQTDNVSSVWLVRDSSGQEYKPEDYLIAFAKYVKEHEAEIQAINILLDRPRDWSATALSELRQRLAYSPFRFTMDNLQKAHELRYSKALVDIISMVKHAADEEQPLLTAAERVDLAFAKVTRGKTFTPDQQQWLDRIRQHMQQNLSVERDDFEDIPIFANAGGWGAARKVFGNGKLDTLLRELNEAIAA
jgi:type I restriction enzyme R subunit